MTMCCSPKTAPSLRCFEIAVTQSAASSMVSTKYARYYGIGGGIERDGTRSPIPKLFDVDASFEDHDHEWYDTVEDPLELVNLAHDRSRRDELRANFERLLKIEADAGV